MGHNTAVLILNDAIHGVQEDPKAFADNLMRAWGLFQRAPATRPTSPLATTSMAARYSTKHTPM